MGAIIITGAKGSATQGDGENTNCYYLGLDGERYTTMMDADYGTKHDGADHDRADWDRS